MLNGISRLDIKPLGLFSASSSVFRDVVNQSGIWKQLFEATAKRGEQYVPDPARLGSVHNLKVWTWNGETGLAECFRMPNQQIIARVGFKKALGCLLSHHCIECGLSTNTANPITMSRICASCAKQSPQSFTLLRSNAKVHARSLCAHLVILMVHVVQDTFLLSEKECQKIPSAAFAACLIGKAKSPDKPPPMSRVVLLSDAQEISYAKFGGAAGLAMEIAKRKVAAAAKYLKSQSIRKPQKKRSKIETKPDRPADNLLSLRWYSACCCPSAAL